MARKFQFILLIAALGVFLIPGCILSSDSDPCKGIDCDGYGQCLEDNQGNAYCECGDNYHADGLHCVFDGYTVTFGWAFGAEEKTCTQVQVVNVEVRLYKGDTLLVDDTVSCSGQTAELTEMENGAYVLDITGLSNSDEEYYSGSIEFSVDGQNKDLSTIVLDAIGSMKFTWVFGAGELDCTASGVGRVKVVVNDISGQEELFRADPVPVCADLGAEISPFYLDSYNLVIEGVCDSNLEVGYKFDGDVELIYPGENDFGPLVLEDIGGCP